MNIWEINAEIEKFIATHTNEDGEIVNPEELERLELTKAEKLTNLALVYKNIDAEAEGVEKNAKELTRRGRVLRNQQERVRKIIADNLTPGEKYKDDKVSMSWLKSTKVEVDDTFSDERFIKYEPKISKSEIKDALKSGEIIEGARLVENNSLQIK